MSGSCRAQRPLRVDYGHRRAKAGCPHPSLKRSAGWATDSPVTFDAKPRQRLSHVAFRARSRPPGSRRTRRLLRRTIHRKLASALFTLSERLGRLAKALPKGSRIAVPRRFRFTQRCPWPGRFLGRVSSRGQNSLDDAGPDLQGSPNFRLPSCPLEVVDAALDLRPILSAFQHRTPERDASFPRWARPALTRSIIISRSKVANTLHIPNTIRPEGVAVSSACRCRSRSTSFARRSSRNQPGRKANVRFVDRPRGDAIEILPCDTRQSASIGAACRVPWNR